MPGVDVQSARPCIDACRPYDLVPSPFERRLRANEADVLCARRCSVDDDMRISSRSIDSLSSKSAMTSSRPGNERFRSSWTSDSSSRVPRSAISAKTARASHETLRVQSSNPSQTQKAWLFRCDQLRRVCFQFFLSGCLIANGPGRLRREESFPEGLRAATKTEQSPMRLLFSRRRLFRRRRSNVPRPGVTEA